LNKLFFVLLLFPIHYLSSSLAQSQESNINKLSKSSFYIPTNYGSPFSSVIIFNPDSLNNLFEIQLLPKWYYSTYTSPTYYSATIVNTNLDSSSAMYTFNSYNSDTTALQRSTAYSNLVKQGGFLTTIINDIKDTLYMNLPAYRNTYVLQNISGVANGSVADWIYFTRNNKIYRFGYMVNYSEWAINKNALYLYLFSAVNFYTTSSLLNTGKLSKTKNIINYSTILYTNNKPLYKLPSSKGSFYIYNLKGELINKLHNQLFWDYKDNMGKQVVSGFYISSVNISE
jgi:hypothetical protein